MTEPVSNPTEPESPKIVNNNRSIPHVNAVSIHAPKAEPLLSDNRPAMKDDTICVIK